MGFTISVTARNQRLRDEMYEFLQRVFLPWSEVVDDDEEKGSFNGPLVDSDLGDESGLRIGFEYAAGEVTEREYHYATMRWVAQQVGKRRSHFRAEGTLTQSVPFVMFDGVETCPVLIETEWGGQFAPGPVVDSLGMFVGDHIARELAWLFIPHGTFQKVSCLHHKSDAETVQEALVQEGLDGAYCCLSIVRDHIKRLDNLWKTRNG